MNVILLANIIALLFSFFIIGAIFNAIFSKKSYKEVANVNNVDDVNKEPIKIYKHHEQRKRVLMFGWEFPPFNSGGLGVACMGLTRALSKKNLGITFVMPKRFPLSVSYAKMVSAELDNSDISFHFFDSPITPYETTESYARYEDGTAVYGSGLINEVRRYARFGAVIAKREPHDIVYAHDWLSFGAGKEAKRISNRPFIAHLHATEFDRSGGNVNQSIYDIEREGLHAADQIITVSHRTKRKIIEHYDIPYEKAHVVWNGIDETTAPISDYSLPMRLTALKKAGYKLVLFMSRITIQKGPDYFVRAAKHVLDRDPNIIFILAGSGDMEYQVMRQAASLDIADKLFFPGFLRGNDQYEVYALADVFVMPSVSEPFGLAALEAMRVGTPVIVSKQSGVAEAAPSALQVDFWDVEQMARLILSVLESPSFHEKLSKNGLIDAARLSWDRSAEEIRNIIDGLVSPIRYSNSL